MGESPSKGRKKKEPGFDETLRRLLKTPPKPKRKEDKKKRAK